MADSPKKGVLFSFRRQKNIDIFFFDKLFYHRAGFSIEFMFKREWDFLDFWNESFIEYISPVDEVYPMSCSCKAICYAGSPSLIATPSSRAI